MRPVTRIISSLFVLAVAACVQPPGAIEFAAFTQQFERTRTATETWLDVLAVAERDTFERANPVAKRNVFKLEDVPYLAPSADPPVTAAYRRGFDVVTRYNEVLLSYATGEAASARVDRFAGLASSALTLATSFGATSLGATGLTGPAKSVAEKLNPVADPVKEIAAMALAYKDGQDFRDEVINDTDSVVKLLEGMRDGAPVLFDFFTAKEAGDSALAAVGLGSGDAEAASSRLADRRREAASLLAEWVLMMDKSIAALRAAQTAAKTGGRLDIATAEAALADISRGADQIRRILATMR